MAFTDNAKEIFHRCIEDYHKFDDVNRELGNPYEAVSLEYLLYKKIGIDTVQWHLEDLIRDKDILPEAALAIKRRIDALNQQRTDLVERLDDWFYNLYQYKGQLPDAVLNTETPAWAVDRLSILSLKIYHMRLEAERQDADEIHRRKCAEKLEVLLQQEGDLCAAIEILLKNIESGKVVMKTYRQMKMYNDEALNPILYQSKKNDRENL